MILTGENNYTGKLHIARHVILESATAERWLAGDDYLMECKASHGPTLRAWPVDRRINNARNEGEDLVVAIGDIVES